MRLWTCLRHYLPSNLLTFIQHAIYSCLLVSLVMLAYHHIITRRHQSHIPTDLPVTQQRGNEDDIINTMSPTSAESVNDKRLLEVRRRQTPKMEKSDYFRRRKSKVNEFKHRAILLPHRQPICLNNTRMIVLVNSHPAYADKRQAIRQTWGSTIQNPDKFRWPHEPKCCPRLRLFFVLGVNYSLIEPIVSEQEQHDDIIQGDFVDSYHNMTLKSLFGLKIVSELCKEARYLLKSDDDMFINLPVLLRRLDKNPLKRSIMGARMRRTKPWRTGKWSVTYDEFPFEFFPPYIHGSSYVISSDVIRQLYEASHYVPWIPLEDVYISGILGRIVGVHHVTVIGSGTKVDKFARPASHPVTACEVVRRRLLSLTHMKIDDLLKVWKNLHRPKWRCL